MYSARMLKSRLLLKGTTIVLNGKRWPRSLPRGSMTLTMGISKTVLAVRAFMRSMSGSGACTISFNDKSNFLNYGVLQWAIRRCELGQIEK